MATRPPDSYLAWTSKDRKKDVAIISVREWQLSNKTETDKNRIDALITFINYKLENGESIYLVFNQNVGSNIPIQFKENVINYPDVSFELQQTNHDLTFSDLKIPYFRVPDGVTCNLKFRKCWIKDLIIESAKHPNYTRNITFDSTYIANLTLKSNSVNSLSVSGGGILDLSLPPPDAHNPFLGSVVLKPNVFFPRTTKKYPISGVQPYRNFRAHLLKLENHQAANIIHVHEQSIERENDNIIDKIISIIYGISSSYGNSTWRPLFGMLVLLLISFMFLFLSESPVIARSNEFYSTGWRTILICEGDCGLMWRAALLSVQSSINPIGVFGTRSLLIADTWWASLWLSMHGVLSTVFFATFIIALRRRFRMYF